MLKPVKLLKGALVISAGIFFQKAPAITRIQSDPKWLGLDSELQLWPSACAPPTASQSAAASVVRTNERSKVLVHRAHC